MLEKSYGGSKSIPLQTKVCRVSLPQIMGKNKIKIFGAVLLVLLSSMVLYQKISIFSLKTDLNIDIPNIDNLKLIGIYGDEIDTIKNIEAKENNISLNIKYIKGMDKEASEDYKNYQLNIINSMFKPIRSPYPGMVTRKIVCSEEFKPFEINSAYPNSTYYLMYSTDRYSYGSCSWDSIKYRVIFLFRYCENRKELYQVEIFVPVDEFNGSYTKMAEKIRCK